MSHCVYGLRYAPNMPYPFIILALSYFKALLPTVYFFLVRLYNQPFLQEALVSFIELDI